MPSFYNDHVRGWRVAALTAASMAYAYVILMVLPYWGRMVAAEGGSELQSRFNYGHTAARSALYALKADAPQDALIFYALDAGNALLFGLAMAALIAFGLRRLHWEESLLRWLVLIPFIAVGADLVENACFAYAVLNKPSQLRYMLAGVSLITSGKLVAVAGVAALAGLATVVGLFFWCLRVLTGRSYAPGRRRKRRSASRQYSSTNPWN